MAETQRQSPILLRKRLVLGDEEPLLEMKPIPQPNMPAVAEEGKPDMQPSDSYEPSKRTVQLWSVLFVVLGFVTRFYKISSGNFVLWDEAHFGKFGSHYLKGTFYFDVHPPLGKMLVGAAGKLAGYSGDYEFKSGETYPSNIPYVHMRMLLSLFGALLGVLTYRMTVQMRLRHRICILSGFLTAIETGLIGITRLILLDSMLIFFATLAVYCYTRFRNQEPFTPAWWRHMIQTGLSIGAVSSVKWVGFFVTALIGLMTIEELYGMLGDRRRLAKHFSARVLGLIAVPVAVYLGSFALHFAILNRSGPGDANMSSLFQARLRGSALLKGPPVVHYGSRVSLKSGSYGGGLLHSHVQPFPEGSKQQQVTTYHHKDANNTWIVLPADNRAEGPVTHGSHIKLLHEATGRFLHSHAIPAPLTKREYEVSGYGSVDNQDPNDTWQLLVVDDLHRDGQLKTLTTRFALRHSATGCTLRSRNVHLPEWGFKQGEVTCDPDKRASGRTTVWNVEEHANPSCTTAPLMLAVVPEGSPADYPGSFWSDFKDCNVGMYVTNNSLTPDPEIEPSILTSRPWQWFFMLRGIRMSSWAETATRFFMLGNPLIWWSGSLSIVANLALVAGYFLAQKRRVRLSISDARLEQYRYRVKIAVGGWALNYLPFYLMGRVTYVHHYYPALVMSIVSLAVLLDHIPRARFLWLPLGVACAAVSVFFAPFAYGMDGPTSGYASRQWLRSWAILN